MSKYTPHTFDDVKKMLDVIGLNDTDGLFTDVPGDIKINGLSLDGGKSQFEVMAEFKALADRNKIFGTVLRGAGSYDRLIPPVVTALTAREELVTAYTPYQAEISQGVLQSIFEYQSLMCRLTGMDVSNASVYDGATAAAEAMTMCCDKKKEVVVAGAVNPQTLQVMRTYAHAMGIKVVHIECDGLVDIDALKCAVTADTAAVFAQSPNFYGLIEDMDGICAVAHGVGGKFVYIFDPIAAALLKSPGECGADIAVGEGQPLGMPMAFGGPYLGIMTATQAMLRRLPGRIVGETVDRDGKRAYVLTMQAREQHIRREKATSSVCSNQALCALTAAVYLSAMGNSFNDVAKQSVAKAHYLHDKLLSTGKLHKVHEGEFFDEFVLRCDFDTDRFLERLSENGILGGLPLGDGRILWCVTEKPSLDALDTVVAIAEVM